MGCIFLVNVTHIVVHSITVLNKLNKEFKRIKNTFCFSLKQFENTKMYSISLKFCPQNCLYW